jgi:hypothetical protein
MENISGALLQVLSARSALGMVRPDKYGPRSGHRAMPPCKGSSALSSCHLAQDRHSHCSLPIYNENSSTLFLKSTAHFRIERGISSLEFDKSCPMT